MNKIKISTKIFKKYFRILAILFLREYFSLLTAAEIVEDFKKATTTEVIIKGIKKIHFNF